ncbi:MAG TPA: hypothetical protein VGR57_04185 [Ktedonobacterales bacterium]|nr:hypothetical protein [Ktedonobacterales bacterium]
MPDPSPVGTAATAASDAQDPSPYTGVVIIHGIGDIKRNTTLQEAVDALTYWYNHVAGLALRPEGAGRVWLRAALTDDTNPDAPAARATLELEPLAGTSDGPAEARPLRLEWREVWWAESFGLPSIGSTLAWARIQAREQARNLLLPIGRRLGPAQTATRAPARGVAQANTYRPETAGSAAASQAPGDVALRALLWIYDLIQYVWKGVQWLVLTPVILLLLAVLGIVRTLAALPFLSNSIVALITALTGNILLHWIAPLQVYMLDYTRAAGIRQRFERELTTFLADERCERIVVIAHSLGTVVAYEGLTTQLAPGGAGGEQKPVTFICLAQALRRTWLLTVADPHRLRGVLPERVRWLHFWARYDPVAAGPLTPRSLPPVRAWSDAVVANPEAALRARLDACENVDVANVDSTFQDHTTYWRNLEQVVGPIARELVTGHPALERQVAKHLATPHQVLQRRAAVAQRAVLAMGTGLAVTAAVLFSDAFFNLQLGQRLLDFLRSAAFRNFIIAMLTGNPPALGCVGGDCAPQTPAHLNPVDTIIKAAQSALTALTAPQTIVALLTIALALAVLSATVVLMVRVLAPRGPFVFGPLFRRRRAMRRLIVTVFVAATAFFLLDYVIQRVYGDLLRPDYPTWYQVAELSVWLGAALTGVAWALCAFETAREGQWGGLVALVVATVAGTVALYALAPGFATIGALACALYVLTALWLVFAGPASPYFRADP